MENFNFKVGDKVRLEAWANSDYVEIVAMGKRLFLGETIDKKEISYCIHVERGGNWQLYEEPKQKQKLQKFYCGTTDELIYPEYWETKEEALKNRKNVYTEAEFLEKFDVEI